MASTFSIFWGTAIPFSIVNVPNYMSTNSAKRFPFPTSLPILISYLFDDNYFSMWGGISLWFWFSFSIVGIFKAFTLAILRLLGDGDGKSKILGMSSGRGQYIEVGLMNIWFVITYEMNYQKFSGLKTVSFIALWVWRSEV